MMNFLNAFQKDNSLKKLDTSEKIHINGLSLLKMLKHARQGIPLEVIGILLGQRIDQYTIEIFDVFSTPQVATGSNVETTDENYQAQYMSLLERTGYSDLISVGWYHSHPGFDVFLSGVDYRNQEIMERIDPRAVAIVIDPIRSVRGRVVIGAFRNIPQDNLKRLIRQKPKSRRIEDPRQKTSFIGHTMKPSRKTRKRGLNSTFYQMPIEFKMNKNETHMLASLHRPNWSNGFKMKSFVKNDSYCLNMIKNLSLCASNYRSLILEEGNFKSERETELAKVGKVDPKLFLKENSNELAFSQAALMSVLHISMQSF